MYKFRLRVLLIVIFGGSLMVTSRLFYLQVVQGEHWARYAEQIRLDRRSLPTARGRILAADGSVLAADLPAFDIVLRLADLDPPVPAPGARRPRPEFRRSLQESFIVDGLAVRDRRDVDLELLGPDDGGWYARLSYSGVIQRREPPPGILALFWKGSIVPEPVERSLCVLLPPAIVEPAANLAREAGVPEEAVVKSVVELARDELRGRASRDDARPVLADVPYSLVLKTAIFDERFRGFSPDDKHVRRYPQGGLAGNVVGYMAKLAPREYDSYSAGYAGSRSKRYFLNDTIGRTGIEARLNSLLRGERGEQLVERDRLGRTVRVVGRVQSLPGCDVVLTLMPGPQKAAEEALAGKVGAAVVIDAATGSVLVLATAPSIDPATISKDYARLAADPDKPLINRPLKAYPLGSTFKVVTALAAWSGGVGPEAVFECRGRFRIGGLSCSSTYGHGAIAFHEALKKSCNVYFCELGAKAGPEALAEWAAKLGFGSRTGIELAGEDAGLVPSPARRLWERGDRWFGGDTANYSIGQGDLLVTPLQAARAMGAVCTGGLLTVPHVVKLVLAADGSEAEVPGRGPLEPEQVDLPAGASDRIRSALEAVVHERGGTAHQAFADWHKPYRLAGKTSTAQRGRDNDVGWFVGVAPADRPRVAFAVLIEQLPAGAHGGEIAAPIARRIVESFPDTFLTGSPPAPDAGGR